jgi:hydrogenase nickel incorporation protein HypA/HybF
MHAVHELAIIDGVMQMIRDRLGERRVHRVKLQVGDLVGVLPDALQFSFELCAQGTSLEGARLEIEATAGDALLIKEVEVSDVCDLRM